MIFDNFNEKLINDDEILIDHNVRDELLMIKNKIPLFDRNYKTILNLVDLLTQDALDSYRYGNSFIDRWITNSRIKKLNRLVDIYNIKVL